MKVTFVEPKGAFEGFSFGWVNQFPMTGQLYLGTILKQRGHDVEIRKESLEDIDPAKLDCDVLCLSIMSSTAKRGYRIAEQFKKHNPDKKVIIGGVHATFRPKEALQYADNVLVGEGESVIVDLVENGYKKEIIQGRPCENLDELPFPDLSLLKNVKLPLYYTPVSTSRGCPFDCTFCSVSTMFGRKFRFRSPKSVIDELNANRHNKIFFYDDNFIALRSRVKEIMRLMKENKTKWQWVTQATTHIANDDEMLKLMSDTNCHVLCIGFESINPKTLKEYNKHHNIKGLGTIKKSIKKIHDAGIQIRGMFVFGSDNDDKKAIKRTVDFCNVNNIEYPQFTVMTPFPGTQLYEQLNSQKRIFSKDWRLYDCHHVVYKPKGLSAYELQVKLNQAVKDLYWFTKEGTRFFFQNFTKSIQILKKCAKWSKANKAYLRFLKKIH